MALDELNLMLEQREWGLLRHRSARVAGNASRRGSSLASSMSMAGSLTTLTAFSLKAKDLKLLHNEGLKLLGFVRRGR